MLVIPEAFSDVHHFSIVDVKDAIFLYAEQASNSCRAVSINANLHAKQNYILELWGTVDVREKT